MLSMYYILLFVMLHQEKTKTKQCHLYLLKYIVVALSLIDSLLPEVTTIFCQKSSYYYKKQTNKQIIRENADVEKQAKQ